MWRLMQERRRNEHSYRVPFGCKKLLDEGSRTPEKAGRRMKLEDIKSGVSLSGIEPSQVVTAVAVVPLGEGSVQLIYRTPDGGMKERLLNRGDEPSVDIATVERPFSFDGDGAAFQLACEAKRIDDSLPAVAVFDEASLAAALNN